MPRRDLSRDRELMHAAGKNAGRPLENRWFPRPGPLRLLVWAVRNRWAVPNRIGPAERDSEGRS
jgi:hypothetical protein